MTNTVTPRQPWTNHDMPKLITLEEAADRIGVSRRTVGRYIEQGQFVALYELPGGHLRCDECDLNEWLGARRTDSQQKEAPQTAQGQQEQ